MRSLKLLIAMVAGGAIALASGGACSANAMQAPPAKKSPAGQTGKAPAPTKQATAPAKQAPAPRQTAPSKAATPAPAEKPSGPVSAGEGAAQISVSPEMSAGNRRDPFRALVAGGRANQRQTPEVTCRAPGKGSIAIDTMRLDGLVRSGEGMIAAVRTPQGRVYFLREGDKLCDGRVERITLEGVTLRQTSRDAFGRGVERPVSKRLFPSAGE